MNDTHNSTIKFIALYVTFAILSIAINILFQMLSIALYKGNYFIQVSIFVGTLLGLPIRYLLEKKYIFKYAAANLKHDAQLLMLYTLMAIFTTLIFWGIEFIFHIYFNDTFMRYLGAVIGLSIGFIVKYQLDKKYVFVKR